MRAVKDFLNGVKKGMKAFGECLSVIINSALLLAVYIIGVGITSIAAKMSGKHFLKSGLSKKQKSYWNDLNLKKESLDRYYKQF